MQDTQVPLFDKAPIKGKQYATSGAAVSLQYDHLNGQHIHGDSREWLKTIELEPQTWFSQTHRTT